MAYSIVKFTLPICLQLTGGLVKAEERLGDPKLQEICGLMVGRGSQPFAIKNLSRNSSVPRNTVRGSLY